MKQQRIGILGSGGVGNFLAKGFLDRGCDVMRGSREPDKLAEWAKGAGASASIGTFAQAAAFGELVILAVKGTAAEAVVAGVVPELASETVLDATNPIADAPPDGGVLQFFTGPNDSLMERLQAKAPQANFVKCFSSVGGHLMVNPTLAGGKPSMFICGNSAAAKQQARDVLDTFGWETEDMGGVKAARAIEPLCILWCIPGFASNSWTHAFKLLKS